MTVDTNTIDITLQSLQVHSVYTDIYNTFQEMYRPINDLPQIWKSASLKYFMSTGEKLIPTHKLHLHVHVSKNVKRDAGLIAQKMFVKNLITDQYLGYFY
jgi:hypothetical protein